jgi:hypothetical protein
MKNPRDLLFSRHQAAISRLNSLRREVLSQLPAGDRPQTAKTPADWFAPLWRELILPCRRVWIGLAVAWAFIFIINFAQRDNLNSITGQPAQPGEIVVIRQNQQRWLNEPLADRTAPDAADRPRNDQPKPRTENTDPVIL